VSGGRVELELERGGRALVLETDGERVTLLAPEASPPGSTVVARLEGAPVSVKVRGCRRGETDETGRAFRIEGRFVSLSRALREKLSGRAPA
jgi:hypothetical protein